jgi:hypothetical protein
MKKPRNTIDLWLDETKMSLIGIKVALKRPKTILTATISTIIFAYIITLFQDGATAWSLLWTNLPLGDKLYALLSVWPNILANFTSFYGLLLILLAILQGLTLALLAYTWKHRAKEFAVSGLQAGSVGAAFGFLALGCPSCGISLFTPILTTVAGTGALALADTLGWIFLILAFILLFHATRRLGYAIFILTASTRYKENHK